jgi:hypothetical protein
MEFHFLTTLEKTKSLIPKHRVTVRLYHMEFFLVQSYKSCLWTRTWRRWGVTVFVHLPFGSFSTTVLCDFSMHLHPG